MGPFSEPNIHSIRKVRKKQIKIPLIPVIFSGINGIKEK
jgi:hypothetical protein